MKEKKNNLIFIHNFLYYQPIENYKNTTFKLIMIKGNKFIMYFLLVRIKNIYKKNYNNSFI